MCTLRPHHLPNLNTHAVHVKRDVRTLIYVGLIRPDLLARWFTLFRVLRRIRECEATCTCMCEVAAH